MSLAACVAAICLYWMSLYFYVPVLSPQAQRLGAGVGTVGLVLAAYGFVQFLLRVPTGLWSDHTGRRAPFMAAALVACGVAAAGMGLARGPAVLGAFRGVSGLGACGWVAITLLYAEYFPPHRAPWAFGIAGFLSTGSQLVATFAGGLIAQAAGFGATFAAAAAAGGVGLLLMIAVREPRRPPPAAALGLRDRLSAGRQPALLAASGLSVASHYLLFATTFGFTPLLAWSRFHATGLGLGALSLCAGAPSALASLSTGRLSGAWSSRRIGCLAFLVASAGILACILAPGLPWLCAAAGLEGVGVGALGPSLMTAALHGAPADRRGTAMGFYQSIYSIGMFTGPALAGLAGARLGMSGLYGTTAALGVAGALLSWWLLPRDRLGQRPAGAPPPKASFQERGAQRHDAASGAAD